MSKIVSKIVIPEIQFIDAAGIELEGGWNGARGIYPYADGSVTIDRRNVRNSERGQAGDCDCGYDDCCTCNPCDNSDCEECHPRLVPGSIVAGEICSDPIHPKDSIEWLLANYPDVSNASCGLHVHVSLRSILRYSQLMDEPFYTFFRNEYSKWATKEIPGTELAFWDRWNNRNHYCADEFRPDDQFLHINKSYARYTQLNYAYSVRSINHRTGNRNPRARRTLECRLFPVFSDKVLAAAAVAKYYGVIEEYLERTSETSERAHELVAVVEDEPETFEYKADPNPRAPSRIITRQIYSWDDDGALLERDYRNPDGSVEGIPSDYERRMRSVRGYGSQRQAVWVPRGAPWTNLDD